MSGVGAFDYRGMQISVEAMRSDTLGTVYYLRSGGELVAVRNHTGLRVSQQVKLDRAALDAAFTEFLRGPRARRTLT